METAKRLFYELGYNQTSFADIARAADIPKGNFYYHFKTKDDILSAVIRSRIDEIRSFLQTMEQEFPEPQNRLQNFINTASDFSSAIARFGCPLGTLMTELGKNQPTLKAQAQEMFDLYRHWISEQFRALGHGARADGLAMRLLSRTQGISLMGHVYGQDEFVKTELAELGQWLSSTASG
ncbi:MAG: TetR/AcrR family transcriptional regulator [Gammaproteobacteria bacterium]|nr:TetR/AcrR family transcriptional regulator [Gammaproteobacteria bacterium]